MLYAYTSGAGNNGSAFAASAANEHRTGTRRSASTCCSGRFFMIVPILALAGNLAAKKKIPPSAGSFPVAGPTFVVLLVGTVVIVGALTFVPALSSARSSSIPDARRRAAVLTSFNRRKSVAREDYP